MIFWPLNFKKGETESSRRKVSDSGLRRLLLKKRLMKNIQKMIFIKNFVPKDKKNNLFRVFMQFFYDHWIRKEGGRKIKGRKLFLKKEMKKNLVEDG